MANDIDMWKDIEDLEKDKNLVQAKWLSACFNYAYNEGNERKAEKLKNKFSVKFGFWGNWY